MQHWYLAAPLAWLVILATRRLAEPDFLAAGSSERSNHTGRPQQIGGFALICCVAVPAILGAITAPAVLPVAAGWLLLFALGLFDDLYDWSAGIKFAVQLLAATLIAAARGARILAIDIRPQALERARDGKEDLTQALGW